MTMKHKNKYFLVFITVLALFALLAVNSQIAYQDTELDTKLIAIDKPTIRGVYIPIENALAYTPLNYDFDDKLNYRIKAVGDDIVLKMKFDYIGMARTSRYYTNTITFEARLARNKETHFWPSPLLRRIKIRGAGSLLIKKIPLNAGPPETRTYKPSTYDFAQAENVSAIKQMEYRELGCSTELGDLWWMRNQDHTNLAITIKNSGFLTSPNSSFVYANSSSGKVYLRVPKSYKNKINFSFKKIGSFTKITGGLGHDRLN